MDRYDNASILNFQLNLLHLVAVPHGADELPAESAALSEVLLAVRANRERA